VNSRITVIVAEDKELFREGLRPLLKDYDVDVIAEAENGLELLKKLEFLKPDVVLLDLEMPVMDGSEALTRIKEQFPNQKVIVLSMHFDSILCENFRNRGANGYVSKDAVINSFEQIPTLIKAIKKVKNSENYFFEKSPPVPEFSKKQLEILRLMLKGLTTEEIAQKLQVTTRAIDKQKKKIYSKVGGDKAIHLYKFAIAKGYQFLEETEFRKN
jgi:NarL family two-component system response regulator LiaR